MKKKEIKAALKSAEQAKIAAEDGLRAAMRECSIRGDQVNTLLELVGMMGALNAQTAAHGRLSAVRAKWDGASVSSAATTESTATVAEH